MHALLVLATLVSTQLEAPEQAPRQGIHIEVRDNSDMTLVSIPDDRASLCQVRSEHPCFLQAEPGRHTFLVDGKPFDVDVQPGESEFQVEHPSHVRGGIGGTLLFFGPPAALFLFWASYASRGPLSYVFFYAMYAALIAPVVGIGLIISDWLMPHTLLVPIDPAHPTALRIQLAPDVAPGRAALGVLGTF